MKLNTFIAICSLTLVCGILAPDQALAQDKPEKGQPDIVVGVDGMSCPFCAFGIEKKLKKLDQVEKMNVHLEKGLVDLYLKPGKELSEEELTKAVEKAGFSVRSIEYKNEIENEAKKSSG